MAPSLYRRLETIAMKCFAGWLGLMLILAAIPSASAAQINALTPQEIADGWILLFDGETQFGWSATTEANWKVSDGVISASSGEPGLLCTTSEFSNYVLKVDFRCPKGTNSGVFLRTPKTPMDPATDCYELNIADESISPFPTGSFVKRKKATGSHDTTQWRTFEATMLGGKCTIKLDDQIVLDYTDPMPLGRGYIGLQLNQGQIEFRNIKLRPLELKSIFNGKDLSGWKVFPGKKSVYSVTPEGALNVKDGNGQIESQGQWADFVLQLDVFSNGKHLNSGIFFRSIPGEFWNGYESQVRNEYKDGDRTQPVDFGTGAIYRRQAARKVVADDFTWFTKTIVVAGNHFSVWVNGYQVTDWTDTRPPHDNPRNGLRTAKGSLIIQGHDPTTDLSFRNIRIAEMSKR